MNHLKIQASNKESDYICLKIPRMDTKVLGTRDMNVLSQDLATEAIDQVGYAVIKLNRARSLIGAQQNRMERAISVDDNTAENTTAADSRIRDTDMAKEISRFAKHNILEQAGQSMLTQANQSANGVMSLLQ